MTDTFDTWIAGIDTQHLADMCVAERAQVDRFLERRGFTIGPEADCVFCGIPRAVLRNHNDVAGHWHCPPVGSPASLQHLRELCDALRRAPTQPPPPHGEPHEPAV